MCAAATKRAAAVWVRVRACVRAQAAEAAKEAAAKEKEKLDKARQEEKARAKKKAAEVEAKVRGQAPCVACSADHPTRGLCGGLTGACRAACAAQGRPGQGGCSGGGRGQAASGGH